MDVAEWLRGLGLEQYAPGFRDNDIDGEVLRRLTGEDLRELGIASVGHRRRLLDAIAALSDTQPAPEASLAPAPALGTAREAERRQLTVLFSDLVGSTGSSPNTWATACWPISAIPPLMKTTPNGPYAPVWK